MKENKINGDLPSETEGTHQVKKATSFETRVLYRRTTQVNTKTQLQLVLPPAHCSKAIEGCHDQVGHLGQDKVLELLRDWFYWPGMHTDVACYINSCPRCIQRSPNQIKLLYLT